MLAGYQTLVRDGVPRQPFLEEYLVSKATRSHRDKAEAQQDGAQRLAHHARLQSHVLVANFPFNFPLGR